MLVVVEGQIAPPLGLPHPRQPIRRRELSHQQPAPRLRIRSPEHQPAPLRSSRDRLSSDLCSLIPGLFRVCSENKLACRINRRNTVSVTPAMGARTVAGRTTTVPSRTSAGTRVSAGIACSTGLSQSLFTVNPRPAISLLISSAFPLPGTQMVYRASQGPSPLPLPREYAIQLSSRRFFADEYRLVPHRPSVSVLADIPEEAPGAQLPRLAHELPRPSTDPRHTTPVRGADSRPAGNHRH